MIIQKISNVWFEFYSITQHCNPSMIVTTMKKEYILNSYVSSIIFVSIKILFWIHNWMWQGVTPTNMRPVSLPITNQKAHFDTYPDQSLPPANEVWGKVIFLHLSVILFPGGVPGQVPSPLAGTHPGRYTPWQVHPQQVHPQGRYTPIPHWTVTPSPQAVHARRYWQQAGSTHPTGMHSCFQIIFCPLVDTDSCWSKNH